MLVDYPIREYPAEEELDPKNKNKKSNGNVLQAGDVETSTES